VGQQVNACLRTCGIPGRDAAELTGETASATRARQWAEQRVFFLTPQTLINDLDKERVDARDIALLVIGANVSGPVL
jgi:ATP-dependent DNA helicase MPH1